jgi:hypothetical protein
MSWDKIFRGWPHPGELILGVVGMFLMMLYLNWRPGDDRIK